MTDVVNNFMSLRPAAVKDALSVAITTDIPMMIWGKPGLGKTSVVREVAKEHGIDCRVLSLTLMDPVDLMGMPVIQQNGFRSTVTFAPLGTLPTDGKGVLFFDEMNTADPSVMAAAMRIVLEGRIGDYVLPEGWARVAAGNHLEDGASANRMPTALADRFTHIEMVTHIDDFTDWAAGNGINNRLLAFLNFRKDLLHNFDSQATVNTTPRGWATGVSPLLDIDPVLSKTHLMALAAGRVGAAAVTELRAFLSIWADLPDVTRILDGIDTTSHAQLDKPSMRYAMAMAISGEITTEFSRNGGIKQGWIHNGLEYLKNFGAEFAKVAVLAAIRRDTRVAQNIEYLQFVQNGFKNRR